MAVGKKPLEYWSKQSSKTGRVGKTLDGDLLENVVELQDLEKSSNGNTLINCPACPRQLLDIRLPFLVIIMKNMNVECCFRVQIIDTNDIRHHFHFCNEGFESNGNRRLTVISRVKLKLEAGWNRVEIDLENLTQRAFNSQYKATQRLEICANCRLRRVYFVDRHYADMEISPALCQAFFHYYMMKWGIHLPKRMSQTDESYSDVRMIESATRRTNKDIHDRRQVNHYQFFKDLHLKSGKLINNFFRRINRRLSDALDVKNKLRLMLFTVPSLRGEEMLAVATRNNANRKSKQRHVGDASYCMTPTRNAANSKGDGLESTTTKSTDHDRIKVDQYKQEKTKANVRPNDDWHFRYHVVEPCRTNMLMTSSSNEKRIQKSRNQDKSPLRNCKASSSSKTSSLIVQKLVPDKRGVKTTASNAKPKGDASFHNVVKSLEGTLDAIREISGIQKPRMKNRTVVKLPEEGKQQHASFLKRNVTRASKDVKILQTRAVTKGSDGVLSTKDKLGSVSCNKNCSEIPKEPKILTAQERGCQSIICEPLSLKIKRSTKGKEKCGAVSIETQKKNLKKFQTVKLLDV